LIRDEERNETKRKEFAVGRGAHLALRDHRRDGFDLAPLRPRVLARRQSDPQQRLRVRGVRPGGHQDVDRRDFPRERGPDVVHPLIDLPLEKPRRVLPRERVEVREKIVHSEPAAERLGVVPYERGYRGGVERRQKRS
jgi:hypothetical protein